MRGNELTTETAVNSSLGLNLAWLCRGLNETGRQTCEYTIAQRAIC